VTLRPWRLTSCFSALISSWNHLRCEAAVASTATSRDLQDRVRLAPHERSRNRDLHRICQAMDSQRIAWGRGTAQCRAILAGCADGDGSQRLTSAAMQRRLRKRRDEFVDESGDRSAVQSSRYYALLRSEVLERREGLGGCLPVRQRGERLSSSVGGDDKRANS